MVRLTRHNAARCESLALELTVARPGAHGTAATTCGAFIESGRPTEGGHAMAALAIFFTHSSGTLSVTVTTTGGNHDGPCQRALTVANNVAIDIMACADKPSDAAVTIAHQIAAKAAAV